MLFISAWLRISFSSQPELSSSFWLYIYPIAFTRSLSLLFSYAPKTTSALSSSHSSAAAAETGASCRSTPCSCSPGKTIAVVDHVTGVNNRLKEPSASSAERYGFIIELSQSKTSITQIASQIRRKYWLSVRPIQESTRTSLF